jgi:general secretion pathway protein J
MGPGRKSTRSGITLVEAMVAVTILAIVATMVWGGFSQTARNKRRVEEQLEHYHVVRAALERMVRELKMAYVSVHVNPNPQLRTVKTAFVGKDRGHRDRLDFTSFSHRRLMRNAHESDQHELSYFVAQHPDEPDQNVLARREQDRVDDKPQQGGNIQILVEDVEELDIEYLDPLSGEWLRSWDTTQAAMQPNRLPAQVKITLTVPDIHDEDETQTFGTRASIPLRWALNHAVYM